MNEEAPPAILRATYSDWKLVKTRGQVQLIFEIPAEQSGFALEVLGGMPSQGDPVWCAIARLQPDTVEQSASARERKNRYVDLPLTTQAILACKDPVFWAYLSEARDFRVGNEMEAAAIVRTHCGVASRANIGSTERSTALWKDLMAAFQAWKLEDSVT